jgi:hypothetical protein
LKWLLMKIKNAVVRVVKMVRRQVALVQSVMVKLLVLQVLVLPLVSVPHVLVQIRQGNNHAATKT